MHKLIPERSILRSGFYYLSLGLKSTIVLGGLALGKRSKSKRFVAEGVKVVQKHDERIPYRERFSDAERKRSETDQHTIGGF